MSDDEVAWHWSLGEAASTSGTSAWAFSLGEVDDSITPTPRDCQDVGPRKGLDASRFLARRAALRGLVGRRCHVPPQAVEIGYDSVGRPMILAPDAQLFCSVSARGDIAALALSNEPVGVDLEPAEAGAIPWPMLHPTETARLRALAPPQRLVAFLELWTLKEAYLKARGSGLLVDPARVAVSTADWTLQDGRRTQALHHSSVQHGQVARQDVVVACVTVAAHRG